MCHYNDVLMTMKASQITILTFVYSTVNSGADQRKYQGPASLAFVRGIHRSPVNSPHKRPVTRKMFPFDDVIMLVSCFTDSPVTVTEVNKGHRQVPRQNKAEQNVNCVHNSWNILLYKKHNESTLLIPGELVWHSKTRRLV